MIALQYIIFPILSAIAALAAVVFRCNYLGRKEMKYGNIIAKQKKPTIIFVLVYIAIALISVFVFNKKDMPLPLIIEYMIFWEAVFLCAVIDLKVKKIPNAIIMLLFIIRIVGLVLEYIADGKFTIDKISFSLLGLTVGGLFMLICMLLSRGGVGAGDVKLIAAIGLYYGLAGVLSILMVTLIFAAIFSIVMLATKKAKMKSTLPMAPFIFIGLSIHNILI